MKNQLCFVAAPFRFVWELLFFCALLAAPTLAQTPPPLTWSDDYFPQFNVRINPEDLQKILTPGVDTKVPMTLEYQGQTYTGTIRQRLGNSSLCGDKRQFRFDFPSKQTFPDGYRADRFETDRGNCYTLHEWIAWKLLDQAAQRHPDLKVLRKKYNVVAISFNGELYHVQTLLEDVNKDLLEPQLGTRNITVYENGCYGRTDPTELNGFCSVFAPAQIKEQMQVPSFLYSAAVIQMLGGNDNYPSYPFNHNFVHELATNRIWFMPDDLDSTIDSSVVHADPFSTAVTDGDSQRHFTELMNDPESRALYSSYLRELLVLLQPDQLKPQIAAKYAQVRETLLASPDLPLGANWYDYVYLTEIPNWIDERYAFLTALLEQGTGNRPPVAVMAPLPTTIEAPNAAGVVVQLNGTASSDPDSDSLTYRWVVDGQEVGQAALVNVTLGLGSHTIALTVGDGRGGTGTASATVQVTPLVVSNQPPVAVIAPLPASVAAADATGATVQLNGTASSDPDNDSLTYRWVVDGQEVAQAALVNVKLSIGGHSIVLTVSDGRGGVGTASATVQVTPPVISNRPPTAVIAPFPDVLTAPDPAGIVIELNGDWSSDPDGDPLTYIWQVDGAEVGRGLRIRVLLGIGQRDIRLMVEDGRGGVGTTTKSVQVLPLGPSIQSVSPSSLIRGRGAVLVITGSGFSPQSFVTISGTGVIPDTYYLRTANSLAIYTQVYSYAAPGLRDVIVSNPDGQTVTLRGAVSIQ